MLHTKGPCKKWFRVPVTKMKLQCYGDAAVLTVAKYAISLKNGGVGEEGGMFYDLFICFQ